MEKENNQSKQFLKLLTPYRKKYLEYSEKQATLFTYDDWYVMNHYLTDGRFEKAYSGEKTAGFFKTIATNSITLDVDDHITGGWKKDRPTPLLQQKYNSIVYELGTPSYAFMSPRGLYPYYLIDQKIPTYIITQLIQERIGKIAEIRPTATVGLRIPELQKNLNPDTLELEEFKFKSDLIPTQFLFDDRYTRENLRADIKSKSSTLKKYTKALLSLESKEEIGQKLFVKGKTNEGLKFMCPAYYKAGLSVQEAVCRISLFLESNKYTGELTNKRRLTYRVNSFYKLMMNRKSLFEMDFKDTKDIQAGLLDYLLIDKLVSECPYVKQRQEPFRIFLEKVFFWLNYIDYIQENKSLLAVFDYLYKDHSKKVNLGYYPLPWDLLRKFNFRYFGFLPFLKEIGFLEDNLGYSTIDRVCKYYRINRLL